ncbi:MAG: LysE family translocator [Pseudooceanicola sp.]
MFPVDPLTLLAFLPAGLALNMTPGADMVFCVGQGLRQGPRAAWAASAGISTGALVHGAIAGLGLGAAIGAHPVVFDVIRWVGVAYLLWLAAASLRANPPDQTGRAGTAHAFRDGLMVNLTNPKVILFVLAFVPQFVDPTRGPVLAQFLIFATILGLGGLVINGIVGASAAGVGRRVVKSANVSRWLGRVCAAIFATLALRLAVLERA